MMRKALRVVVALGIPFLLLSWVPPAAGVGISAPQAQEPPAADPGPSAGEGITLTQPPASTQGFTPGITLGVTVPLTTTFGTKEITFTVPSSLPLETGPAPEPVITPTDVVTVELPGPEGTFSHGQPDVAPRVVYAVSSGGISNGGFENGDLTGWTVPPFHETNSIAAHVENLAAGDFSPVISPTEGSRFALLCNGPGTVCSGNSYGDVDGNSTLDAELSIMGQAFTLGAGEAPAILAFDWSFLTGQAPPPGSLDDFFHVALNGNRILKGSVDGGGVSPYPDVPVAGSYTVPGSGFPPGCSFGQGRSPFSNFSTFIGATGTYTVEFLVADQGSSGVDSGLLVDNVRVVPDPCDLAVTGAFTVTKTADTNDGTCDADCSLREAIVATNGNAGRDRIAFNIPGAGPHIIQPNINSPLDSPLPTITDPVVIDGYTQPGAVPADADFPAELKIVLDGSGAGNGINGLVLETDDSAVCGLNIHSFRVVDASPGSPDYRQGNTIVIRGSDNLVAGNFLGTNVAGDACAGNGGSGVLIGGLNSTVQSDENTVGGPDPEDRNVITCNGFQADPSTPEPDDGHPTGGDGIAIRAEFSGGYWSADRNEVQGNYIGTDVSGTTVPTIGLQIIVYGGYTFTVPYAGNTGNGVRAAGTFSNTVGGTVGGEGNLISGNGLAGVRIEGLAFDANVPPDHSRAANENVVQGNYIGPNADGTAALGNVDAGVYIVGLADNADQNLVGGTDPGAGNVISGNGGPGVMILGGQADHNVIQGNYIGTDPTGTAAVPNTADGVHIQDAEDNTVGGTTPAERNLISGNGGHGMSIADTELEWQPELNPPRFKGAGDASGNIVGGNYIGSDLNGTAPVPNSLAGVLITDAAGNTVGGDAAAKGNLISGNGESGVLLLDTGNPGNVETDVVTAKLASGEQRSDGTTVTITGAPGGLEVTKTPTATHVTAPGAVVTFTVVVTNHRGVDVMVKRLSDSVHGDLNGKGTCSVPQLLAPGGHYACAFSAPVYGQGPYSETDTVVASGTDVNGVFVLDGGSATVTIGPVAPSIVVTKTAVPSSTTTSGSVNFTVQVENISAGPVTINKMWDSKHGQLMPSLVLCGVPVSLNPGAKLSCTYSGSVSGATGNTIQANYIGADVNGTAALPNGNTGVLISDSPDNAVGGVGGRANLIAGNAREGVYIIGPGATGNHLYSNPIGLQLDYTTPLPNGSHGVLVAGDASDNEIDHNSILHNAGAGVVAHTGTGTYLWNNGIDDNGGLGIDLGLDGVTANDDQDPDPGPNLLQNYPLLTCAETVGPDTQVRGTLNSTPNTQFWVEYFSSPACDPSGFGEGRSTQSGQTVTTDGTGNASVDFLVGSPGVPSGYFVTATATDPYGNTSEFSNCTQVDPPPPPAITDLAAGRSGNDLILTWSAVSGPVADYNIYRAEDPYFTPAAALGATSSTVYTDTGVLADPNTSYYYLVTAANCTGAESGISNRVGSFHFSIVPGAP